MVNIASKRFELCFDKKLQNSVIPISSYLRSFLGNFRKSVFAFLNPVKWEFFVEFMKESCVFQLPFKRVVPRLGRVKTRRDIAFFVIFSSYS